MRQGGSGFQLSVFYFLLFPEVPYAERAEITLGATRLICFFRFSYVWVLSFLPSLHSALNFANCSLFRMPFASCLYLASLASEQPAF